jgi:glyoxylase-like metal-dependent hydrolase (beta-lactamase superfamily II)
VSTLDVRTFTLGPVQTNGYIVRAHTGATECVLVDPGEEPQRLLDALVALAVEVKAILITHCHFDHIGAVAAMARATGAPVWCPEAERIALADINSFTFPGFGPFEGYAADHVLSGGERLDIAGMEIEVLSTPGHSPGHLTFAVSPAASDAAPADPGAAHTIALFSGDVLFVGSVGRVDLPGGDWGVLENSIAELIARFAGETPVYPGHMGATTLGRELATNPFLEQLRERAGSQDRDGVSALGGAGTTPSAPATAAPAVGSSNLR